MRAGRSPASGVAPPSGEMTPMLGDDVFGVGEGSPERGDGVFGVGEGLPERGDGVSEQRECLPERGESARERGDVPRSNFCEFFRNSTRGRPEWECSKDALSLSTPKQ